MSQRFPPPAPPSLSMVMFNLSQFVGDDLEMICVDRVLWGDILGATALTDYI
jgi:hypothetical protein